MRNRQMTWIKRTFALLVSAAVFLTAAPAYAEEGGFSAEDVTLQPGGTAAEVNLNWYAESGTNDARVKFTAGGETRYAEAYESAASDGKVACKASVSGLAGGTDYRYQISNDGGTTWSREYSYKTSNGGDFVFAFMGDPQLNSGAQDSNSAVFSADSTTLQGWKDTLAAASAAGAEFIASSGDQVDNGGSETQYTDFFAPEEMQSLPFAAAVGNHDMNKLFLYHYNFPNEQDVSGIIEDGDAAGATTLAGNYYYSYNNALFVVLNTSPSPGSTKEAEVYVRAYEQVLKAATEKYPDYRWLFVQHHRSTESVAQHVADWNLMYYTEAGFERLMDKYQVDFVLAGHDHVYARTWAMNGGKRMPGTGGDDMTDPAGTIYITCNTASGLKYYRIFDGRYIYVSNNESYPLLANGLYGSQEYLKGVYPMSTSVAAQSRIPGYTVFKVDGDKVEVETHSTYPDPENGDSTLIDAFTVEKTTDYRDVVGHWAKDDIDALTAKGVFAGTDRGVFSPDDNMERCMFVTALHRLEGEPSGGRNPFEDVRVGRYYTQAVTWAAGKNIVEGTSATTFSPHDFITREELAAMLYRYASYSGKDTGGRAQLSGFGDAQNVSSWAEVSLEWAVGKGIIVGDEKGLLNPAAYATRAEVASMLNRFDKLK